MKKIILSALALAVATLTIQAQDMPGKKHHSKGRHHAEVFQQLNLTEDQQTQVKTINDDFRKQVQELKKNENITVKDQKDRMQALRNDHKTKMQNLLTSDQKAQLEKMKQDRKATHEVDAKAKMDKMKIRLGLSDDQVARLKKSRTETAAKMKAIHENASLTDDQKKEQAKELMKQRKENLKSILTEEQLKKMQDRGSRRPSKQPA
jgi:Spy/CpxP family protein refolding chaperone